MNCGAVRENRASFAAFDVMRTDLCITFLAQARIHELQHPVLPSGIFANTAPHFPPRRPQVLAQGARQPSLAELGRNGNDSITARHHCVQLHLSYFQLQFRVAHGSLKRHEVRLIDQFLDDCEWHF